MQCALLSTWSSITWGLAPVTRCLGRVIGVMIMRVIMTVMGSETEETLILMTLSPLSLV